MSPEDIGGLLFEYLRSFGRDQNLNRYNLLSAGSGEILEYAGDKRPEVVRALAEGWNWLENEGLIALNNNDATQLNYFITRRGWELRSRNDLEAFKLGSLLIARRLDERLANGVMPLFLRGDYDTAIFQAFKEVEMRVRDACSTKGTAYPNDLVGTKLMRAAFHSETGPLRNTEAVVAERDAMSATFAGAIGLFKNPPSHRSPGIGAVEASELIYFANHLLRIVDSA